MSAKKESKDVNKLPQSLELSPAHQAINGLESVICLLDTESWLLPEKAAMKRKLQEFVDVIQNDSSGAMTGQSKKVSTSNTVLPVEKKFRSVTVQTDKSMFPKINNIPNECLTLILKLIPLQELLPIRIVCIRWKENIDSYCRTKKTLKILNASPKLTNFRGYAREIYDNKLYDLALNSSDDLAFRKYFFGPELVNFLTKTFTNIIHLTLSGFGECSEVHHKVLLEQWHNLQSLTLNCVYGYNFSLIKDSISTLHSLRRLNLLSENIPAKKIPSNILAKLEHFSINLKASEDFDQVFLKINSNCKIQLQIRGSSQMTNKFMDLGSAAQQIIHLQIKNVQIFGSFSNVPNLGNNLTNLTYFEFEIPYSLELDLHSLMKIIVSMKSLVELHVLRMDFRQTKEISKKLQQSYLHSPAKRVFFTHNQTGLNCPPKVLCVVLSSLFPDLEMLTIHTGGNNLVIRQGLRENLKAFPKLIESNIM